MRKTTLILAVLLVLAIFWFALSGNVGTLQAQGSSSDPDVSASLQQILANQQKIMQHLDDMSKELQIIKIRASR